MLIPGGQLIVVGTPFHQEDMYSDLTENPGYKFVRYTAYNDNDVPLWPTRYPLDVLVQRREEIGSTRFAREYLCVPISDDSSLFPEKILFPCFDSQYEMPIQLTEEDRHGVQLFTGVDLAMSSSVGADYSVITTLAVDSYRNRWMVDIRRKKGLTLSEQLREIENVYRIYPRDMLLVLVDVLGEAKALDKQLHDLLNHHR